MTGDDSRAIAELRQEVRGFAAAAAQDRANTKRQFTTLRNQIKLAAADEPRRVQAIVRGLGVPLGLTVEQLSALAAVVSDQVTDKLVEKRKDHKAEGLDHLRVRWSIYIGTALLPLTTGATVYLVLRPIFHLP